MLTPLTTVTSSTGRTFAVRFVPAGARYGRANVLTNEDQPCVEFYDTTYADDSDGDYGPGRGFGPLGQFVSRYNVSTLLGEDKWGVGTGGLLLDGSFREWAVDAEAMTTVRAWLRETRAGLEAVSA